MERDINAPEYRKREEQLRNNLIAPERPKRTDVDLMMDFTRKLLLSTANDTTSFEQTRLPEAIDKLTDQLLPRVTDGTVIDGGNFMIRNGEYWMNPLSTATFEAAAMLLKKARGADAGSEHPRKVQLAFLVDNFSFPNRKNFQLPEEYLQILKKYGIDPKEIIFFYENTLRNQVTRRIKSQLVSPEAARRTGKGVFITQPSPTNQKMRPIYVSQGSGTGIARMHRTLKMPTPVGTALLAEKLLRSEEQGSRNAINLMDWGSYLCRDGSNADVYHDLGGTMPVTSVYFIPNEDGTVTFVRMDTAPDGQRPTPAEE